MKGYEKHLKQNEEYVKIKKGMEDRFQEDLKKLEKSVTVIEPFHIEREILEEDVTIKKRVDGWIDNSGIGLATHNWGGHYFQTNQSCICFTFEEGQILFEWLKKIYEEVE